MYTPRYLSQFNQAQLLARLEALESEVAALHRAPRTRVEGPSPTPVSPAPYVIDALRKAEERAKREADEKRKLDEAARRDFIERGLLRTPFEEHWERRYGPQPTLANLPVGTPSEALRATRVRLPEGVRLGDVLFNGRKLDDPGPFLRDATRPPETTGREILDSIQRAKNTIRKQSAHDDTLDCFNYLTRTMYQRLDPSAPSQELRRPLSGKKVTTAILDDHLTLDEKQAIRQSIMDGAREAQAIMTGKDPK